MSRPALIILVVAAALLAMASSVAGDACAESAATSSCGSCVDKPGCGWCSWGQGSCQVGTRSGPTSSTCYDRDIKARKNWYFGTCTDQCYLICGLTCSSSQTCVVNREVVGTPKCSCQTKSGIIIAAVVASIFCFCLTLTIFVYVRRRNALKYSMSQQNTQFVFNNGPSAYVVLPNGASQVHAVTVPAYLPPQMPASV